MTTGRIDLSRLDTASGARGPFAPPAGWRGDAGAYLTLMRVRYRSDPEAAQQILAVARRVSAARFEGPWAEQARGIAEQVHTHIRQGREPRRAA